MNLIDDSNTTQAGATIPDPTVAIEGEVPPVAPAPEGQAKADEADDKAKPEAEEIATAEEWARRKKMVARFVEVRDGFVTANPLYQDFAQARAHGGWPMGKELTEAQFDAAVKAAQAHEYR